ncbi:ERCC4 domain-containing protein [Agriterribacter sp.]|uniref:ERCC4 domain-containing protein n=1 Tax=Agriterribacter sp. TaxID=2821509 RepID=UPI002BE0FF27|nr:ERCC4 domain-containing protein [Agriterribacter sp.]HRP57501.1 ERCC4 domain-containing protein [Agriterribacter sp.]
MTVLCLPAGDYIINRAIGIERKSAEDFVQSIIANRLFDQIARLKRSVSRTLLVVEGNPYATAHEMHSHAIRGAILSVLISWQVPVIFSKSNEDTVALLLTIARQDMTFLPQIAASKNHRSKKMANRQLFFLQGIPGVGPLLAARLLKKFGTLKAVINATEEELKQVEGIGGNNAKKISGFISAQFPANIG